MAGYGLTQAVQAYQQGTEWRQRQDQMGKQREREAKLEQINTSTGELIKKAEADDYAAQQRAWLDGGNDAGKFQPKPFTPPDDMMFKVSMQRGKELLKAGFIEDAVRNEALTQAERLRVRQGALERFRMDRDHVKLAMANGHTIPNGIDIVEGTTIEGAPEGLDGGVTAGMPARPKMIKLKLSNGTTRSMTPQQIEDIAMRLSDPKAAEHEAASNLAAFKAQVEADKQAGVERVKGEEARKTDRVRTDGDVRVENVRGANSLAVADRNNEGRRETATIGANATLGAAKLGKEGRVYAADKSLEGAKAGSGAGKAKVGASAKIKDFADVHTEVTRTIGERNDSTFGSGARISNEDTQAIARYAKALMDEEDADPGDAINRGIEEWKKRKAPTPGGKK